MTGHHIITVSNDIFDHMDCTIGGLAKKKTQCTEDLYFPVKFAQQKQTNDYTELTSTTSMCFISAHILYPFRKLRSLQKWDKGMVINCEEKTSYTTQHQEVFLKCVENHNCAKHPRMSIIKSEKIPGSDYFPSGKVS